MELVCDVGETATRSPLAAVVVDCTPAPDGAVMFAPVAWPALGSAGLPLLIGAALVAGAELVADVAAAVAAGEAGAAAGVGAVVEAALEVSVGGALAVDEVSEVVACGAGLLTVAVVSADVAAGVDAGVSAGVEAAAVADEVAVDAWSVGAAAVALES